LTVIFEILNLEKLRNLESAILRRLYIIGVGKAQAQFTMHFTTKNRPAV